jgi:hypothetical protein
VFFNQGLDKGEVIRSELTSTENESFFHRLLYNKFFWMTPMENLWAKNFLDFFWHFLKFVHKVRRTVWGEGSRQKKIGLIEIGWIQ